MTQNILLPNGEEIILIEVPENAYGFGIAYPVEGDPPKWFITYHFQKTGNKFEDAAWKQIDTDIPYSAGLLILGTYQPPDKIDFVPKAEWFPMTRKPMFPVYQEALPVETKEQAFISILQSLNLTGKYMVLKKGKTSQAARKAGEKSKLVKEAAEIFNAVKHEELACSILEGVEFKDEYAIGKAVSQIGKYLEENVHNEVYIKSEKDLTNAGKITGELKPCPFCGCTTILSAGRQRTDNGNIVYDVFCTNDDCRAMVFECMSGKDYTPDQVRQVVIEKWNKRTELK